MNGPLTLPTPASWLLDNEAMLPRGGMVLDVACGRGRHALYLSQAGFQVTAIDRDPEVLDALRHTARVLGLDVTTQLVDLETSPPHDLGDARYDAIVVFHYSHRPLFPALQRALRAGGRLVYETFTTAQAAHGKPTNPAFLLQPGELQRLVAPLTVSRSREGEFDGRWVASVVAERS